MAPRFPRRRRDHPDDGDAPSTDRDEARLDDDEHAWWAKRDISEVWTPREEAEPATEPARDVLAEHFGEGWRSSFGFDTTTVPPPPDPAELLGRVDTADPYAVLEIDATATWDEIVDAHRRQARHHHPDRLVGRSDAEISAGEDRIRAINAAYAELRIRRGK